MVVVGAAAVGWEVLTSRVYIACPVIRVLESALLSIFASAGEGEGKLTSTSICFL